MSHEDEVWNNFKEKVTVLFSCVKELPDRLHKPAVQLLSESVQQVENQLTTKPFPDLQPHMLIDRIEAGTYPEHTKEDRATTVSLTKVKEETKPSPRKSGRRIKRGKPRDSVTSKVEANTVEKHDITPTRGPGRPRRDGSLSRFAKKSPEVQVIEVMTPTPRRRRRGRSRSMIKKEDGETPKDPEEHSPPKKRRGRPRTKNVVQTKEEVEELEEPLSPMSADHNDDDFASFGEEENNEKPKPKGSIKKYRSKRRTSSVGRPRTDPKWDYFAKYIKEIPLEQYNEPHLDVENELRNSSQGPSGAEKPTAPDNDKPPEAAVDVNGVGESRSDGEPESIAHEVQQNGHESSPPSNPTSSLDSTGNSGQDSDRESPSKGEDHKPTLHQLQAVDMDVSKTPETPRHLERRGVNEQLLMEGKSDGKSVVLCLLCDFKALQRRVVENHLLKKHPDGLTPYLCHLCGKGFPQRYKLRYHISSHTEKTFQCLHCDHRTHTDELLKRHIINIHSDQMPGHMCELCGVEIKYQSSFIEHMRRHYGEKPHQCNECPARFVGRSQLAAHIRIHRDRPEKCLLCNKKFIDKHKLKRHMTIHTGEKEFGCDVCSYRCNTSGNLRKHIVTVHKMTVKERYSVSKINIKGDDEEEQMASEETWKANSTALTERTSPCAAAVAVVEAESEKKETPPGYPMNNQPNSSGASPAGGYGPPSRKLAADIEGIVQLEQDGQIYTLSQPSLVSSLGRVAMETIRQHQDSMPATTVELSPLQNLHQSHTSVIPWAQPVLQAINHRASYPPVSGEVQVITSDKLPAAAINPAAADAATTEHGVVDYRLGQPPGKREMPPTEHEPGVEGRLAHQPDGANWVVLTEEVIFDPQETIQAVSHMEECESQSSTTQDLYTVEVSHCS